MKKFLFCSISFSEYGDEYHYISDIATIKAGDYIIVPTGKDDIERVGRVEKIQYYSRWTAPYPINKAKKIIRICTDDDNVRIKKEYLTYPENSLRAIYRNNISINS